LSDVAPYLTQLDADELLLLLQQDQRNRWESAAGIAAEEYLREFGSRLDDSQRLDLIYHEYVVREDCGAEPDPEEYQRRFPLLADAISRQLDLHAALAGAADGITQDLSPAATLPESRTSELPLPSIDGFEIREVIGRGAMGVVYHAVEVELRRPVAVKMLLTGLHSSPQDVQRLRREAEAAARLRHPNIVTVHRVGSSQGMPFLVMELIDGQTLADRLASGPLPWQEAVRLAEVISEAVAAANAQSVIHRDLKPANVLLDQQQQPFVTDFGLARVVDGSGSLSGHVVGTPQYMSPEQARGEAIDAESDVYSIGVILYEMLTGRPPFQAATTWDVIKLILQQDPPRLRDVNPLVPHDLQTVCEKCLEKDPSRRYATASELAEDLRRVRTDRPVLARPAGPVRRLVKWCHRNRLAAALSAMIATVLFGVTIAALWVASTLAASNRAITASEGRAKTAEQNALADRAAAVESFNSLVEDLYADLNRQTGTIRGREAIISNALQGLQKIADRSHGRDVDRNLAVALMRSGDLRTLSAQPEAALQHYQSALQTARTVAEQHPNDREVQLTLALCSEALAIYHYRFGDLAPGLAAIDESIRTLQELHRGNPDDRHALRCLVSAYNHKNDLYWRENDFAGQLQTSEEGTPFAERLRQTASDDAQSLSVVGTYEQRFGRTLVGQADYVKALEHYQQASDIAAAACALRPDDDNLRATLLIALRLQANCQTAAGQFQTAVETHQQVVQGTQQLADADPGSALRQAELIASLVGLGNAYYSVGDFVNARNTFEQARDLQAERLIANPDDRLCRMGYCQTCIQMALLPILLERDWEASAQLVAEFRRVFAGEGELTPLDPTAMQVQLMLADLVEEPIRRYLGQWNRSSTDNGTGVLIGLELLLNAEDQHSTPVLSDGTDQVVPESVAREYDDLFDYCHGLSMSPLPAAYVWNLRARTAARFAEQAEQSGDEPLRQQWLQKSLDAVTAIRSRYPMFAAPLIEQDGELWWLRATPEFASLPQPGAVATGNKAQQ
jgi:tetratricopeptide (TPR) repeat protein